MRHTTKEWIQEVRQWIEAGDKEAVSRAVNHPKMLYSTMALSAVARTGDQDLLAYTLEHALAAGIMDLTNVFKTVAHAGHANTTQQLLDWAQSNNTFDAPNPYLRTVLMVAVENNCVEIWRNNAHQVHTIPQGLMKTYYFKAVESESLNCLDYFKEHMDTDQLQAQALDLAVGKLKKSSTEYFLKQHKSSGVKAGAIAVQVCIQHSVLNASHPLAPDITSMLLMLMDYSSPDQMLGLGRFGGAAQEHPLHPVLEHINTTVRAQQQSERLNLELDGVQSSCPLVGRKL